MDELKLYIDCDRTVYSVLVILNKYKEKGFKYKNHYLGYNGEYCIIFERDDKNGNV